jgi:hypothetical protein
MDLLPVSGPLPVLDYVALGQQTVGFLVAFLVALAVALGVRGGHVRRW